MKHLIADPKREISVANEKPFVLPMVNVHGRPAFCGTYGIKDAKKISGLAEVRVLSTRPVGGYRNS
jgi:hypothetical protein